MLMNVLPAPAKMVRPVLIMTEGTSVSVVQGGLEISAEKVRQASSKHYGRTCYTFTPTRLQCMVLEKKRRYVIT